MKPTTSVAMTAVTASAIAKHLIREDGQEDICLATYRPSSGGTRFTALIRSFIAPIRGDRSVHGNATITSQYVLRGLEMAVKDGCGVAIIHSHPGAADWQQMSALDRDCESSYANLVRESTDLPLVGMTLATGDLTWSARHWDVGTGKAVDCTHSTNVRVVGEKLAISWNGSIAPAPRPGERQLRTVSAWGEKCQDDLVRRKVLVVGMGSVGLDVAVRLAASGLRGLTLMDFDIVERHNLDRLIGANRRDARLARKKSFVAKREALNAATAAEPRIRAVDHSICEPGGVRVALDHDLIVSCVDRPWPRAVLNSLAFSDLIPVIDGGIAIDSFEDGTMRNATWRSHVIRPGRACMSCNRQLDMAAVALDRQGLLEDPSYIDGLPANLVPGSQNVAPLSINASAGILAQYVSFNVAPSGFGDPGPLQYLLSTHELVHRDDVPSEHCAVEKMVGVGDHRIDLTGAHDYAAKQRDIASQAKFRVRLLRHVDGWVELVTGWLNGN